MSSVPILKQCKEEVLIALMTAMSAEDDLGPKANSKCNSFHHVHNRITSHSPISLAKLQDEFIDVVSPLPSCIYLIQQQFKMNPGLPLSKQKTAFATLFWLHPFVMLPVGIFRVPTTLDRILRPNAAWAGHHRVDHLLVSGTTDLSVQGGTQDGGTDGSSRLSLQEWGCCRPDGLLALVGRWVCGRKGVVEWGWQQESKQSELWVLRYEASVMRHLGGQSLCHLSINWCRLVCNCPSFCTSRRLKLHIH